MTTLGIVCFDGVTDLDVFLHWDLLNRPLTALEPPTPDWRVCLIGTSVAHTTQAGLSIPMHASLDSARRMDAVLHASGPATRQLIHSKPYLASLALDATRQFVAGQCSGSLVLGASGCLDGLTATTYPTAVDELRRLNVSFLPEPLVAHDRVATAAGCLAGVELDRWLLGKFLDAATVDACLATAAPWPATRPTAAAP